MKGLIIIYNLLFPLALLLMLPGVVRRMVRRGNYAHKFGQRFAVYSKRTRAVLRRERGRWVWVHAVSVGEVLVALKFIKALQKERDVPVLLSTTTSTGFALASSQKSHRLEVIYHPVDFFLTARKVIGLVQPAALVLVEAEVWPNLTVLTRKLGAPVLLINARLSKRSEKRFRAFRFLVEPLFRHVDQREVVKTLGEAVSGVPFFGRALVSPAPCFLFAGRRRCPSVFVDRGGTGAIAGDGEYQV